MSFAVTPGEIVLKNPLIELIRYKATTRTVHASPILIFPPWINKYYVLDLTPANSMVGWLRDQGFTVYMVSWRSADDETKDFGWDDYLKLGGRAALDFVHAKHKAPVNVAGYCVGGALASILSARLADQNDARMASLTLLAAQTDFSEPGDLGLFIDDASIGGIEQMITDAGGVIDGKSALGLNHSRSGTAKDIAVVPDGRRIFARLTVEENLIPACRRCNGAKSSTDWREWFAAQAWHCPERAARIDGWISRESASP
jgi:poly(3-hydroxyalkanoate) synthetase